MIDTGSCEINVVHLQRRRSGLDSGDRQVLDVDCKVCVWGGGKLSEWTETFSKLTKTQKSTGFKACTPYEHFARPCK